RWAGWERPAPRRTSNGRPTCSNSWRGSGSTDRVRARSTRCVPYADTLAIPGRRAVDVVAPGNKTGSCEATVQRMIPGRGGTTPTPRGIATENQREYEAPADSLAPLCGGRTYLGPGQPAPPGELRGPQCRYGLGRGLQDPEQSGVSGRLRTGQTLAPHREPGCRPPA